MSDLLAPFIQNTRYYHYPEVTSTMDFADNLIINNNLKENFVVCADKQNRGRGRKGNDWISDIGGLWFTLGLYDYSFPPSLMIYTGIILRKTIHQLYNLEDIMIKWPNDIFINGKKCCGIISTCNPRNKFHLIGIGINTNNSVSLSNSSYQAVSLSTILNHPILNDQLLDAFLKIFYDNLVTYQESNLLTFLDEFKKYHLLNNLSIQADCGNEIYSGQCLGIEQDGGLLLKQTDSSVITVYAGTISIL